MIWLKNVITVFSIYYRMSLIMITQVPLSWLFIQNVVLLPVIQSAKSFVRSNQNHNCSVTKMAFDKTEHLFFLQPYLLSCIMIISYNSHAFYEISMLLQFFVFFNRFYNFIDFFIFSLLKVIFCFVFAFNRNNVNYKYYFNQTDLWTCSINAKYKYTHNWKEKP